MTAEIAVLNKTAVALAADSAVTISAGRKEEKIFNTADKLFELSNRNAIGVMMYSATSFVEIPLPSLIREYRLLCPAFDKISDAARHFLNYLHEVGSSAPEEVKRRSLGEIVTPVLERIGERFTEKFRETVLKQTGPNAPDYSTVIRETMDEVIASFARLYARRLPGKFVGGAPTIGGSTTDFLRELIDVNLSATVMTNDQKTAIVNILKRILRGHSPATTVGGIVIAGYGSGEIFPTLASFELDGMVCDKLKYRMTHTVDIDRAGPKAKVLPFAQKEMVERFLYGLDADIQKHLRLFCTKNISSIREKMLETLQFENDAAREAWIEVAKAAESGFLDGLAAEGFGAIRSLSESEIETMVEFMPKPELAKMAEALVNLTSIKRQVSRGMETVGGPVDVAVISASEGFVWVKRKHYFPAELNARYFERIKMRTPDWRGSDENSSPGHDVGA